MLAANFTAAGGVPANNVARWDGSSWSALGPGVTNNFFGSVGVDAIAAAPSGELLVGGNLSAAGGTAYFIARWNGSAWTPVDSGFNADIWTLATTTGGDIIAGGQFTLTSSGAADNIARWDGNTWSTIGSGLRSSVLALAELPNGDLIAGGSFSSLSGAPANGIARWNGSAWLPFGSGANSSVTSLAVLPNGDLVAGGNFSLIDGVVANRNRALGWQLLGSARHRRELHPGSYRRAAER